VRTLDQGDRCGSEVKAVEVLQHNGNGSAAKDAVEY
jgi:hypothetical protein